MVWMGLGLLVGLSMVAVLGSQLLFAKLRRQVSGGANGGWNNTLNLFRKLTWQNYLETQMRAETGKPATRPYGNKRAVYSWDHIVFNPVYFSAAPLDAQTPIETEVVLGNQAQKPLKINLPMLIGGMAYGSAYSAAAKIALAKGAALAGTAANSGNGPFLADERAAAGKFILQYTRGFWSKNEAILRQADMLEIALGHSARASAPVRIEGQKITFELAKHYQTIPGLDVLMEARLPEVETLEDWKKLIRNLKEVSGGVPIAVKFGASHYLEREIELFVEGGVDVLVFDGLEGGTHGGMPLLMDDFGLPLLPALCRAVSYLRHNHLQERVSLVVGGGLVNPGDFAKCLALGANAVLIGTVAALVQSHTQVTKTIPWEPPTTLLYHNGNQQQRYNAELGGRHIYHFLQSCSEEMKMLARCLGKNSLKQFQPGDLLALDPLVAEIAGIAYVGGKQS